MNNSYFQSLFPKIKEQKPGKDFYTWIGLIQFAILIFLIPFYTGIDKDYTNDSSDDFTTNQFSGTMVIAVFIQIAIIIGDRYFYLSRSSLTIDSNELNEVEETISEEDEDKDETHNRSTTSFNRGSSIQLKSAVISNYLIDTFKTKNNNAFKKKSLLGIEKTIEELHGNSENPEESQEIRIERNNSHKSIMMKYYFQLFLLIFIHYVTFFYFPNRGNTEIQGHNYCDYGVKNSDQCNEVRLNPNLWWFYLLYCLYFAISALQIKYGLPELRKGVFVSSGNAVNKIIFKIYRAIPFLVEIKIITDWTFTKTSLDLFQWIQFETIYAELYIAKCENKFYMNHQVGKPINKLQKFLMGALGLLFVVALVAGPLAIFSSLNPVAVDNKVTGSTLKLNIEVGDLLKDGVVNKYTIYENNYVTQLK
jgi:hypothetical protein